VSSQQFPSQRWNRRRHDSAVADPAWKQSKQPVIPESETEQAATRLSSSGSSLFLFFLFFLPVEIYVSLGIYTCGFSHGSITHTAVKSLKVALLPDYINGVANPQFPDCRKNGLIQVNLTCSIKKSNETYTVKWNDAISNLRVTEGWSSQGCKWEKQNSNSTTSSCVCDHLTSFSVLMSKFPISLPWLDEIGYVGVGVSICSLMLCLVIEFLVWNSVVKSNISHFRHTALVNISISLLIADCCFLAASFQSGKGGKLCLPLAMAMHISFLAMFFWMLCQSIMLLHQMIFLFQQLRKKMYLSFSFALGYLGPIFIVIGTYIVNPNKYYRKDSCWLMYEGGMKGSIFAFVLPVGIIVFINIFTLVVVISKLLRPSVSEGGKAEDMETVKSILKAVIILTPVFGLTWALGFLTMIFDLPETFGAKAVHYLFSILNSLQGLFILITGCFTEKKVRDALLKHVNSVYAQPSKSETSNSIKK
ncbi:adhesion G-protein coupled receptor F3-like, partial [Acipenser oxyrinchus oxyrinchus]